MMPLAKAAPAWLVEVQRRCAENARAASEDGEIVRGLTANDDADRRRHAAALHDRVMRGSRVPDRYRDAQLASLKPDGEDREAVSAARAIADTGFTRGLGVFGPVGPGKSHLAAAMCNAAIAAHATAKFFSVEGLLSRLHEASAFGGDEAVSDVMREIIATQVVVLDDLGSESQTARRLAWLWALVDARWSAGDGLCMVVTSNYDLGTLLDRYTRAGEHVGDGERGRAIIDRIRALTYPWVELRGRSRRGASA